MIARVFTYPRYRQTQYQQRANNIVLPQRFGLLRSNVRTHRLQQLIPWQQSARRHPTASASVN